MDSQYWKNKWATGDTRFHLDRPHEQLVQHFSKVPAGKVMVPLCGKSRDLLWLRSQGHEVVGIELSSIACEAFFEENKITYRKAAQGDGVLYESDGITLWCGDYFSISATAWQGCTALYDRAALIALPKELRQKYAHHLIEAWGNHVPPGTPVLLVSVEYDSTTSIGPPFSISEDEILDLYGSVFNVRLLNTEKDRTLSERPPKFTGIEVIERAHWLTRK